MAALAIGIGAVPVADAPGGTKAGVVVTETVDYYDVGGSSVATLWQNIGTRGPRMNSAAWAGHARWDVSWSYDWRRSDEGCRIDNPRTELAITYTLPRWSGREEADPDLRERWDRFSMALRLHEEGHGSNGRRAAQRIQATLTAMQARETCEGLVEAADDAARRIVDEEATNDRLYDATTRHGLVQGVVLH